MDWVALYSGSGDEAVLIEWKFLNGERTEWSPLDDGDELTIGRYRLYFLAPGKSPAGSMSPAGLTAA